LKRWDKAIRKGEATTLEPSRYLIGKLLEELKTRRTIKKAKKTELKDLKGLVININNGGIPILNKTAEVPLKSSSVNLTGNINQTLVNYIEE
jgi:hypothetical protein